jgi:hypothetical protein
MSTIGCRFSFYSCCKIFENNIVGEVYEFMKHCSQKFPCQNFFLRRLSKNFWSTYLNKKITLQRCLRKALISVRCSVILVERKAVSSNIFFLPKRNSPHKPSHSIPSFSFDWITSINSDENDKMNCVCNGSVISSSYIHDYFIA